MLKLIALLTLLAAPQLDPSLTPQKAPKPALPKIDEKACPFEGCQFGAWTATDNVQLFSTWKEDRKPVAVISKGEAVTAITGVHVTFEPSEIQVTAPIPAYGLKAGDTVYGYMYKGEGVFSGWKISMAAASPTRAAIVIAMQSCSRKSASSGGWKSRPRMARPAGQKTPISLMARMA